MTKFVVDAATVLHLVSAGIEVPATHQLFAPTLLRSQVLSMLHEAVERGEIPADVARGHLASINRMPIRLRGDGVLRRRAWDPAVALTQLQADAFITLDTELARSLDGVVATASIDALR
jgi:predicted nucleic acid-binding protein